MSNISLYANSLDTIGVQVNYRTVLSAIKKGRWKDSILALAPLLENGDKDGYGEAKRALPSVTFSGYFPQRLDKALESYTQLLCLDLDHLTDEQITLYRDSLKEDKFIHAYFLSPSQQGMKILVKVSSTEQYHLQAYLALEAYFKDTYIQVIDPKCKNISRLCYISYDPDLYLNDDSGIWQVDCKFKTAGNTKNHFDNRPERFKNLVIAKDAREALKICVKWTKRHHQYTDGNRNTFLHILASNLNRAGVHIDDALVISYDEYSDLDFKEVEQCFKSAYSRKHEHNSIDIYTEKEKLSKEDAIEAAMGIEERLVYDATVELFKAKVKPNTISKIIMAYAVSRNFSREDGKALMLKGRDKVQLVKDETLIIHKSAEDCLLEAVAEYKDNGRVSTGVEEFDEALNGGLQPGNFYAVIGKGKSFKSIFVQCVASENAKNGGLSLYFNGEMSLLSLLDRVVEKELGLHLMRGLKEKSITNDNVPEIMVKLKDAVNGNFEIINSRGWTREGMVETVKDIEDKTGKKVTLIVADGLSQMDDTKKDEIKSAIFNAGEMKEVAKETNSAVIALIHTSNGIQSHVRDTSKSARGGDKIIANTDAFFCTSLLIDEHSSNMETQDLFYLPGKFYLRMEDKRGSGAILSKIIQVQRPLRLEPLSIDPYLMEVSLK